MKPLPVTFYVFADEEEIEPLQRKLNSFVRTQLSKGGLVSAAKLNDAIERFSDSYIVNQYFR